MSTTLFHQTYTALVDTLASTFPREHKCADNYNAYQRMQDIEKKALHSSWVDQVNPYYSIILSKNEGLFKKDIPVIIRTGIVHLWISDVLTPTSKQHIWAYLQKLCEFSGAGRCNDIKPPPHHVNNSTPSVPDIQETFMKLYESLPADVVDNVNNLATKVSSNLSTNEVNYANVAGQLLNDIDPKQIANVLQKLGGILQNSDLSQFSPEVIQGLVSNVQGMCSPSNNTSVVDIE